MNALRRGLAVLAIVMALPYLGLKIAWLSGSRIGLVDPDFGSSTTMHVLNAATLGLDVVVIVLAVVFYRDLRAPAWLVLPPMWIGYGLLGKILLATAPSIFLQAGSSGASAATGPIATWVYVAVYAGFCGIGLGLLPAFALYARRRWGADWSDRLGTSATLPRTRSAPVIAVTLVIVAALVVHAFASPTALAAFGWWSDALLGVLAALAVAALTGGRAARLFGGLPRWVPLLALWFTSGAWTAWGVYGRFCTSCRTS